MRLLADGDKCRPRMKGGRSTGTSHLLHCGIDKNNEAKFLEMRMVRSMNIFAATT